MNKKLAHRINIMFREDQKAVRKRQQSGVVNKRILKNNIEKMKSIVATYGWPGISLLGKKASKNAWILVQHADDDLSFQKKCLHLMKMIYKQNPRDVIKSHIAFLTDRIQVNEKKKQRFGTQFYTNKKGIFTYYPIRDIRDIDKRRKAYGIEPLEEYIRAARLYRSVPIKKVIE